MAGINSYAIVEGGAGEAAKQVSSPAIAYTKAFAEGCGRGPAVESTRAACVAAMGEGKTKSVEACCWYLQWGKTTGNTVNKVRNALFKPWTLYKVSLGELATFSEAHLLRHQAFFRPQTPRKCAALRRRRIRSAPACCHVRQ